MKEIYLNYKYLLFSTPILHRELQATYAAFQLTDCVGVQYSGSQAGYTACACNYNLQGRRRQQFQLRKIEHSNGNFNHIGGFNRIFRRWSRGMDMAQAGGFKMGLDTWQLGLRLPFPAGSMSISGNRICSCITSLLRTLIIIPAAAAGHFGGHLIVSENNLIRTL